MESNYSRSNEDTQIYPYCYKIKENCPPCAPCPRPKKIRCASKCLLILSKLMSNRFYYNKELKQKYEDELFDCLKRYGDIYKELNIELFENPKTARIIFPEMDRIQANFNLFLKKINTDNPTPEEKDEMYDKFTLYNILLNQKLKEKYDEFYYSYGFSDIDSLEPNESGAENNSYGGKNKIKIKQTKKIKKIKKKNTNKKKYGVKKNKTFKKIFK